jgi:hypothetical protein
MKTWMDFKPFQCLETGEVYRSWRRSLLNTDAAKGDDRGDTIADTLLGTDMGGVLGPPMPAGGGAAAAKLQRARRTSLKGGYALIVKHLDNEDITNILAAAPYFQDGVATRAHLDTLYDTPLNRVALRKMQKDWDELSIVMDVGVTKESIMNFVRVLKRANGDFPAGQRKSNDEMTEKLLESIMDCSKHFNESATTEYEAPVGSRQFEHLAPHPLAGQRDFLGCARHYAALWEQAVTKKFITPMQKQRPASATPAHLAVDAAHSACADPCCNPFERGYTVRGAAGADHPTRGPRNVSPGRTLHCLAEAGFDVRRDTTTTTDWEITVGSQELHDALLCDGCIEHEDGMQGQIEAMYDADDHACAHVTYEKIPYRGSSDTTRRRSMLTH